MARRPRRSRRQRQPPARAPRPAAQAALLLALLAFAIYCANLRCLALGDSLATSLLPITLLTRGSLRLDEFQAAVPTHGGSDVFSATRFGFMSPYPIATPVLLLPLYAPAVYTVALGRPGTQGWLRFARVAEKLAAAVVTAGAVAVFFLVALRLGAPRSAALLLTLAFAFATQAWSTWGQALWQHGPGVLAWLLAVLAAIHHRRSPSRLGAVAFGLASGAMIAIRPTNALVVAPLGLWFALSRSGHLPYAVGAGAAVLAPFIAYNQIVFRNPAGLYGRLEMFGGDFASGVQGLLFSPGRGLLLYFPIAALAVVGTALAVRRPGPWRLLALVLAAVVVGQILLVAALKNWWGGAIFGPRYLSEAQPALLLLCIPLFASPAGGRLWRALFAACAVWSSAIQWTGAFLDTGSWNAWPAGIDESPQRLWNWRDNPISRELHRDSLLRRLLPPRALRDRRASYSVPERWMVAPGAASHLPVEVRNEGGDSWTAYGRADGCLAVHLSSHLYSHDGRLLRFESPRAELPGGRIAPGETVAVPLPIQAPAEPGVYRLDVTLVQECVDWFDAASPPARVRLVVPRPPGPR